MLRNPARAMVPGPDAALAASGPGATARRPPAAAALPGLTLLPVAALATIAGLAVVAPTVTQRAGLPLAVIGLLVGVPHGAVDHLLPRWADLTATRAASGALVGAYLTVAGLAAAALVLAPTAAVLAFLLLSALHFGTAETAFAGERRDRITPRPWNRPLASGAHGAVVVGLLLWARPHEVDPWLRRLAPGAADVTAALRFPGLLVIAVLVLGQVGAALWRSRSSTGPVGAEALPLAELAVLLAAFALAPPLAALGVYFGAWHALRHTGRLLDLARRPGDETWRPASRRLAVASLLPTAVALTAMAGLLLARDRAPVVVEVAVLLALTFPHSAAVWSVDIRRHRRGSRRPQSRFLFSRLLFRL